MKRKWIRKSAFCIACLLLGSTIFCGACQQTNKEEGDNSIEDSSSIAGVNEIVLTSELDGREVDVLSSEVRAYLDAQGESEQVTALQAVNGRILDGQHLEISWEGDGSESYSLLIADNTSLNRAYVIQTEETKITSPAFCIPGVTYYYQVRGETSVSKIDSFKVKEGPRMLSIGGASNVRDLGGWVAGEKKVAYGKLFRGGKINEKSTCTLSSEGKKIMRQHLGIRTEIDLRFANVDDGGQSVSMLGTNVTYLKASFHGYGFILPEFKNFGPHKRSYVEGSTEAIKSVFSVLADETNYPIYFHCNAGADRTGTLAFLINGLLGVSKEDLIRDFELTSFSVYGSRYRGEIENGAFINGVMQDDYNNFVAMGLFCDQLLEFYASEGEGLQEAIENYLKLACKVTDAEIEAVRNILLED